MLNANFCGSHFIGNRLNLWNAVVLLHLQDACEVLCWACLSVCLCLLAYLKTTRPNFGKFLNILIVAPWLMAWCSFDGIVICCLPLGLASSTSYSIHFFTQSLSSFHNTCPYHRNLFCCSIEIMSSNPSLCLNSLLGILSCSFSCGTSCVFLSDYCIDSTHILLSDKDQSRLCILFIGCAPGQSTVCDCLDALPLGGVQRL